MQVLKTILTVITIFIAITGIILCSVGIVYSWTLNTPVTERLVTTAESIENVLTVTDRGLTRVGNGITGARSAVNTIDGAVRTVGDTIVNTDIAFSILEQTVGDELFPRVIEAHETASALAETVVATNTALETANNLPFVSVPTFTEELQQAAGYLENVRTSVNEVRTEIQAIKEEAVGRPVNFITTRTGTMIDNLDAADSRVTSTLVQVNRAQVTTAAIKADLPRIIDLISIGATVILLWFIIAQLCLLVHSWRSLRQMS
jgi:hypothetical protein